MIYTPAEHEPLTTTPWDEERVRATIARIAAETEDAFSPETLWPVHERDADYGGVDVHATHGLWSGAAGVLWALHHLARSGAVTQVSEYEDVAAGLHSDYLRRAGGDAPAVPGLWMGEAGILLVAEQIAPDSERADRLLEVVRANERNETLELMWGSPGTMLAASVMYGRSGDDRWLRAWEESADWLWSRLEHDEELDCDIWVQDLYGMEARYLGPAHGFVGNVLALERHLDQSRRTELADRLARTIELQARREDGLANWPPGAGGDLPGGDGAIRVQWCHGAPGIVASLACMAEAAGLATLLAPGGELTWTAGPLRKGPGLCHGTAGNGFALLALHGLTGERVWLDRARAFAVHALEQVERERELHGRGRFTLWTGDLGAAVFAWQCVRGEAGFPTIDLW